MRTLELTPPKFNLPKDSGLHTYLYRYACMCANLEINPNVVIEHMKDCVESLSYHREVPDREIESAVEHAYKAVMEGTSYAKKIVMEYNPVYSRNVAKKYQTTIDDLKKNSPMSIPSSENDALKCLFLKNELVCLGKNTNRAKTLPLDVWIEHNIDTKGYQYVVPNPMTSKMGVTKDGKMSSRAFSNTGKRRRIVCDFDKPDGKIQPSLIVHLSIFCGEDPELVLFSGNKSLHAWWRIDDWPVQDIETFEEEAAKVGADSAVLGEARKNQFFRLPGGLRNNGNLQEIYYWNPKPINL
ncbi:MAG: hypothetical protein ACK49N_07370 [Verrucomicrobiota bacterium]